MGIAVRRATTIAAVDPGSVDPRVTGDLLSEHIDVGLEHVEYP